jgi:hypothetical protein
LSKKGFKVLVITELLPESFYWLFIFHSSPDYHLMTDEDYLNGQILLIDKPLNWTLSGGK